MIKILENSIDFSKLGNHTKEELKSEVKRAVILQESKVLELEMDLNFVLPVDDLDLFKRSLVAQLPGIEDVVLLISYSEFKADDRGSSAFLHRTHDQYRQRQIRSCDENHREGSVQP